MGSNETDQDSFEFAILKPQPPECLYLFNVFLNITVSL